jgi:hypothetical protein
VYENSLNQGKANENHRHHDWRNDTDDVIDTSHHGEITAKELKL